MDFTDLNKTCPKDSFLLSRIDQLVDSAFGHERMSFLDAFQGYHQIPMTLFDQEKTAFITPRRAYCYRVMSFGLKNVGATKALSLLGDAKCFYFLGAIGHLAGPPLTFIGKKRSLKA